MKCVRRVAGYGPWAVAAALGLEISYPVVAQTPVPGRPSAAVSAVAEPAARIDAGAPANIMIAWMADAGLFRCHLTARPGANGIELTGLVPNDFVRQKAINIAKAVCPGPVVDRLRIQQGMPVAQGCGAAPAELAPDASTLLAKALGEKVLGIKVSSPSDGQIEITGRLNSLEDKLLASRCLQELTGCNRVVNRIQAPGSGETAAIPGQVPLAVSMPKLQADGSVMPSVVANVPAPMISMPRPTSSRSEHVDAAAVDRGVRQPGRLPAVAPKFVETAAKPKFAPPVVRPVTSNGAETRPAEMAAKSERPASKPVAAPPLAGQRLDLPTSETARLPAAAPPVRGAESKPAPADVVDALPVVTDGPAKVQLPTIKQPELPKALDLPAAVAKPASAETDRPKRLDLIPEMPKAVAVVSDMPKPASAVPEMPVAAAQASSPIVVPPLVEAPKPAAAMAVVTNDMPKPVPAGPTNGVTPGKAFVTSSPYGGAVTKAAPAPEPVKPATLVKEAASSAPAAVKPAPVNAADSMSAKPGAGKSSATDLPPVAKVPTVVEPAKPVAPEPAQVVTTATTPVPAAVEKTNQPEAAKVVPATANPTAGTVSVSDLAAKNLIHAAPKVEEPRQPIPVVSVPEKPKDAPMVAKAEPAPAVKTERGSAMATVPTTPAPLKPVSFAAASQPTTRPLAATTETTPVETGPKLTGIIRQPAKDGGLTLDAETARRAVEDCCRGAAGDVKVGITGARQMTVAMAVGSQQEWDRLYAKIKALPEVSGYAVIYNVQVRGTATATAANPTPAATPAASVASTSAAPLLGVIRTTGTASVEPEAATAAIETLCRGKADQMQIRHTNGKQLSVTMKVGSAADWDKLYSAIKAMPELAGYSIIYNVSVK